MQNGIVLLFLYSLALIWSWGVGLNVTPIYSLWVLIILSTISILGELIFKLIINDSRLDSLSVRLVIGALILNTLLYIFAILLPFGFKNNFLLIIILVLTSFTIYSVKRKEKLNLFFYKKVSNPELLVILITPLLVGLWCQDFLKIVVIVDGKITIQAWQDIYYHLTQINIFSISNGWGSINDPQMSGSTVHPYHHASYMLSSLLVSLTEISTLNAYAIVLVPVGLILTIYAAFSLSRVVFGEWPALAGSLSILLLPDGFQQGMGNPYLSYHWLIQIGPALGYGIAAAAIAMALLLSIKNLNDYKKILLGYFFVFICLIHKAHIFVPISFVALLLPIFVAEKVILLKRLFLIVVLSTIFILVVSIAQFFKIGPTLSLSGANLLEYSATIFNMQENGLVRELFKFNFGISWASQLIIFPLYLLLITFGIYPFLYLIQIRKTLNYSSGVVTIFPLLAVFIYLLMAVLLEYDKTGTGAPEELLHRPFVWSYFILVLWTSSITYINITSVFTVKSRLIKYALCIFTCFLIFYVYIVGSGMQENRIWGKGYQKIPECYFKVTEFIKNNSNKNVIIQDSLNDKSYIWTGLSERQAYAADSGGFREPSGLKERLKLLNELKQNTDFEKISSFFRNAKVEWYITSSKGSADWESKAKDKMLFSCDDYRVYRF